ncbi:MAG: hypothetical protein AAF487_10875 [Bacteroidota bacterium]
MRTFCSILVFLISFPVLSQVKYDYYNPFTGNQNLRSSGMYIGLGGTYTIPGSNLSGQFTDSLNSYLIDFENKGKLGAFFEIGRWHILNYGPFQSVEYGLSYRQYRGGEEMNASQIPDLLNGELVGTGQGQFSSHYAHLNLMFNRAVKMTKFSFVQVSIGADVGYRFINSNEYNFDNPEFSLINTGEVHKEIDSHLNFRLSYATRVNRMYWIPFVQTSFFNISELSLREANLPYFNSRYKPVIFGLRVQWLHHKKDRECAKKGPKNKKIYKKSKSLFGKDMKSNQLRK